MRLECQYTLEPPTDPSAEAPSWSPAAGAMMRSSVSGLMRLVSEKNRNIEREGPAAFSFPSITDDFDGTPQIPQDSFYSRQRAPDGLAAAPAAPVAAPDPAAVPAAPDPAAIPAAPDPTAVPAAPADDPAAPPGAAAGVAAAAAAPPPPAAPTEAFPFCLGMDLGEASQEKMKEEDGWAFRRSTTEVLTEALKGLDESLGSVLVNGNETEGIEPLYDTGEIAAKNAAQQQDNREMKGVSLQGLFFGVSPGDGGALQMPLADTAFEIALKEEQPEEIIPVVLQERLEGNSNDPMWVEGEASRETPTTAAAVAAAAAAAAAATARPSAALPVLLRPRESLSPAVAVEQETEKKDAAAAPAATGSGSAVSVERDPSERSTVGYESSTRDRPKDTDTSFSEGGNTIGALHREEPLHAAAEPQGVFTGGRPEGAEEQNATDRDFSVSPEEISRDKRSGGCRSAATEGSPSPTKLYARALSLPSLHSRLLQMTAAGSADWGSLDLLRMLGALPDGLLPEEEAEELREDVLFYEADGHYTETGEEYCMPLGEQQQLVKLLPSNLVSVRANSRKFSFLFVPSAGELHLYVYL